MIPLISFIEPANIHEGKFLHTMIQKTNDELSMHIDIVVGDMGYISSETKMELREQFSTMVLTKVRGNMRPAEQYFDYGCPECSEGTPLLWDGYNADDQMHRYITSLDNPACQSCWLYGDCYQEVYVSPTEDEHRFGIIPLHTRVSQRLLQMIRPQVERGFDNDKNKLYLNRFFINSLELARIIGHLSDACQVLFLFADMKTKTKSKAEQVIKGLHTQLSFDF